MNCLLVTIGTLVLVTNMTQGTTTSSLKPNIRTSDQVFKRMRNYLDFLQKFIKNIADGKCHVKNRKEPYGAVYTRWGHKQCPGTETSIVYSGYAGGSYYTHSGGGAEYLCLPKNPTKSTDRNKYSHFGYVYGAEYELSGRYNLDVPCAVCQSLFRAYSLMLPGRDVCPDGWHKEYKGLLMSSYKGHNRSQYVCVDNARKTLHGSHRNDNGKLFYPVTAQCGSLQCPPYKQDQLLTCCVCTR